MGAGFSGARDRRRRRNRQDDRWLEAIAAGEARSYKVLRAQPTEREAQLSYGALAGLVGAVFEGTRGALPAPQERALAAALLLADLEEPAESRRLT